MQMLMMARREAEGEERGGPETLGKLGSRGTHVFPPGLTFLAFV